MIFGKLSNEFSWKPLQKWLKKNHQDLGAHERVVRTIKSVPKQSNNLVFI